MCFSDNCCYFVELDAGCVVLGAVSFILSSLLAVASSWVLVKENIMEQHRPDDQISEFFKMVNFYFPKVAANIVLGGALVVALVLMVFSVMLLLGIKKNKPGFVLAYFSFGIMVTIMALLTALLELLQNHWAIAFATIITSMVYIHCLVVVHTTYDLMQRGNIFGSTHSYRLEDEEPILHPMGCDA